MLRIKKKAAEAAAAAAAPPVTTESMDTEAVAESSTTSSTTSAGETETKTRASGMSLLGIGGRAIGGDVKKAKKRTPGEIRIQKDIAELDGGRVATVIFPNPNDLTSFTVEIVPDSGLWTGAKYVFHFVIPDLYPHEPPKVTCSTKIYHPNINLEGAVCLNILREEWKPVLDINAVIYGLIFLFYEPNPDDPLNRDAASLYRNNKPEFERNVKRSLRGDNVNGESFPRLL